ncbi:porin family protein [Spirosoma endophyticum]|uniref:Outer membrane protein beta-barrel domain-containing protein n=1 Tax=Spirosoma endophyticum TaxID=662367 RepID=A0A1I1YRZ5_9BACT|nr:porin family protein [Spirosoma endophyticum]SFE22209.1 Outer membrane protein beta-barrel domain-containing protein [Spirosoma endophyticum]
MNPVKSVYSFLAFILLSIGLSFAQTSGTTTKPTATTSTNRQQELYDEYHGITKKPATGAPSATPVTNRGESQPQSTNAGTSRPTVTGTAGRPEKTSSNEYVSNLRIGVRGGVTRVFFTESQPLIDPGIGFVGGVMLNVGAGTFSFQPEVNYARYNLKVPNFGGTKITGAFDQIEVPLFLKIATGTYAGNRFFVNVGPYGSYLASVSVNGKKESIDSGTERFQFGAAAGVGAALKAGPGHVTIEVRGLYQFGDLEAGFTPSTKTVLAQGTIGYSFPLGGGR